ncbi:hypothetical protein [Pseudophaeobacter leonis]|uniref:hypothetical protein n=1 Tax=Pseudophaeobacter leonis TaxID=1144477 RepID=UPI0009F731DB|nr:hypothetical protein [Pseudophaeobacter leonis]
MTNPIPDVIGVPLTTVAADLFTVPASKVRHILQVQIANVDGANGVDVTLQWTDASDANAVTRLAYQITIAAKDARTMLAGSAAPGGVNIVWGRGDFPSLDGVTVTATSIDIGNP